MNTPVRWLSVVWKYNSNTPGNICIMNSTLSQLRPLRAQRSGFTLLEIMLVVAIIALLAGVAIVKMGGALEEASDTAARAQIEGFKVALISYRAKGGNYPSTEQGLKALMVRPQSEPIPRSWSSMLEKLPKDPWNHEYIYEYPGRHTDTFDVYSAGRDGKAGTDDDIGNWEPTAK